jgi:hypothetical protein
MLVSEPHPAAQAVLSDGIRRHFDDVGCPVPFLEREKSPPLAAWVNEGNGGWVPTGQARFVSGQRTPMGFTGISRVILNVSNAVLIVFALVFALLLEPEPGLMMTAFRSLTVVISLVACFLGLGRWVSSRTRPPSTMLLR